MRRMTHTKATRLKLDLSQRAWMASVIEGNRDCGQMITEQVKSQRAMSD